MNTSISPSPKNERSRRADAVHERHRAGELPEVRAPRDHEHGLDVEDDEQHRDHVELDREPLARVAERRACRTRTASASPAWAASAW